jgi:Fe-S-cluster containining protein
MSGPRTQELADRLAQAQSDAEIHDTYKRALGRFDGLNEQAMQAGQLRVACCAGCSLCCSLRIDVYAHEVFLIAEHLRENLSKAQMADLMAKLAAHSEKVLPLTPLEHVTRNIPCPLLQNDGRCSVYSVRPETCRRHHSLNLATCQFTYDHPMDLDVPAAHDRELFHTLTEAMRQDAAAYAHLGFDRTIYELGTALEEALTDPESWEGWRNRMEAFIKASVTPKA